MTGHYKLPGPPPNISKIVNIPDVVAVTKMVVFREQAATHRGYKNASLFFLKVRAVRKSQLLGFFRTGTVDVM